MRPPISPRYSFFLLVSLWFYLIAVVAVSRLVYPFDMGDYEAYVWTPARLIIDGQNPYNFATRPPFVMSPYGPLYYLIIGAGLKLFGYQLWFGRALSVVAACVCLFCVGRISAVLTRAGDGTAALLAVLAALSSLPFQNWLAVQRPDFLALAFAFTGLTLVFQFDAKSQHGLARSLLIVALFVAAYFCKQTMFLFVGVAAARYLQLGKPKHAIFVSATTLALCLLIIFALNIDGGGHLWQHWVLARDVPRSLAQMLRITTIMLGAPATWVILLIILAPLFSRLYWAVSPNRRPTYKSPLPTQATYLTDSRSRLPTAPVRFAPSVVLRSPDALIWAYLIAASALALVTSSLVGSSTNYWLEASLVASIAVALSWTRLRFPRGGYYRWHLLFVVLLTVSSAFMLYRISRREYFRWSSLPYYQDTVATLARSTSPQDTCISVFPELATAAGREYHFGDSNQYIDGRSPLLTNMFQEAVASKRYAAIVWMNPQPFPGYRLVPVETPPPERFFRVYLYVREP